MIATILLVIGCLFILAFPFAPRPVGPARSFTAHPRWLSLTDGAGFILLSRAFASGPMQIPLTVTGAIFISVGGYFTWRALIARWRTGPDGSNKLPAGTSVEPTI
jgi:hypothetical protein